MKSLPEKRAYSVNGGNKEKTCAVSDSSDHVKQNVSSDISSQKDLQTLGDEKSKHHGATPSNKGIKHTSANDDASLSRPLRMNEEPISDVALFHDPYTPTSGHPLQTDMKQSEDSSQPFDPADVKDGNRKLSASRKRARPQRQRGLASGEAHEETVVQTPSKSDAMNFPFTPIVVGLTHNGKMIDPCGKTLSQHLNPEHKKAVERGEKNVDGHESVIGNESEQQKEGEVTNLKKKKRGRPPKESFLVESPKTNKAECLEQKNDDASEASDDQKECLINDVEQLSDISGHSIRSITKKQIKKRKLIATAMHKYVGTVKKGKKQKPSKQVEIQTEDALDNSKGKAIEVIPGGIDKAVAGATVNVSDDDRPLSAWFEGAVLPSATDCKIPPAVTADQSDGNTEREENKTALVVHASVENNSTGKPEVQSQSTAIVPVEEQGLPFVKNSLIWQQIDNMEVLKRIPQNPHFRPLYKCKETCREGLALGSMVTFTSLVENISKSLLSDSRSLLDEYSEALVDLEVLGFTISPVREQLNKLKSLKDKYEQAQNTAKEIESQIMEHNLEKATIDEEMADLDREIAELMEKRALCVSKKERKEAEITLLQTSIDVVKSTIETTEKEFVMITSALG